MSQIKDTVHLYLDAMARRARDVGPSGTNSRNLERRLKRTRLTLASLQLSEKHEREALSASIETRNAATLAGTASKRELAAIDLETEIHRSNLIVIGRQIKLVAMAVQYLERRTGSIERAKQSEIHVPVKMTTRLAHFDF